MLKYFCLCLQKQHICRRRRDEPHGRRGVTTRNEATKTGRRKKSVDRRVQLFSLSDESRKQVASNLIISLISILICLVYHAYPHNRLLNFYTKSKSFLKMTFGTVSLKLIEGADYMKRFKRGQSFIFLAQKVTIFMPSCLKSASIVIYLTFAT